MGFSIKHIDVSEPDAMRDVEAVPAHRDNPFIYRLVCQVKTCGNAVWPSQLYDVRMLDFEQAAGVDYACDGCVSNWLRRADVPFTTEALMAAHGASDAEIKAWQQKCTDALPPHVFVEGE